MKRYWKVMCDRCGDCYEDDFVDDAEAELEEMIEEGWSRGVEGDFCPRCAVVVAVHMGRVRTEA